MDFEFIPIAIPLKHYEMHVAKLITGLLLIDEKLNSAEKSNGPEVVA